MMGTILVLNAGSSSIKASAFAPVGEDGPQRLVVGEVSGIGTHPRANAATEQGKTLLDQQWPDDSGPRDHEQALALILGALSAEPGATRPVAGGHGVVHGGAAFSQPAVITPEVRQQLEELVPLAPLHQPHNLKAIDAASAAFPDALQVACFDTAFHRVHGWVADTYALPRHFHESGIRRYGFHGLSYEYIVRTLRH